MDYLYQFHVAGFFFLPFFYQNDATISWKRVLNIVVRNWIPYLWVCMLCWCVFSLYNHHFDFGWSHVMAFFNGTQTPIVRNFGFIFPWFLPTYCSVSIMLLFARNFKWFYFLCLIMGICTFFLTWPQYHEIKITAPFATGLAIRFFALGAITFATYKYVKYGHCLGALCFIVLSICWWNKCPIGLLYEFLPVSFFLLLISISNYIKAEWIELLGKYSLGIFLFHVFVLNLTYHIFPHTIIWGVIDFVISVLISLIVTICIYNVERIKKFVFPRTTSDLIL